MKVIWALALAACAAAQTDTRGIVPEEVIQGRPAPKKIAGVAKVEYQPVGPGAAVRRVEGKQVGVTIWKLRRAGGADGGVRLLVQDDSGTEGWIPERVASTSNLVAGDRVRLTLESPEAGYLYVIDREKYASGEEGAPYLIFPTTRTASGDNRVAGGRLVDIPAQGDRPNFFTLRKSREDQTEEELTVLLTKQPIDGLNFGAKPLALSVSQVADWQQEWGRGRVGVFELKGGAGKSWTRAEQMAAADGTRLLTQDEPPPQTVYRVEGNGAGPLLVTVKLRYRAELARGGTR